MTLQDRIAAAYPEGLTGIFVVGGTRTSFITQQQRDKNEPGEITDFEVYAEYGLSRSLDVIATFFELGGMHAILEILDIHRVSGERSGYIDAAIQANYRLIDEQRRAYYQTHHIDPYFAGIDTLLYLPGDHPAYQLARAFQAFQRDWQRHPSHHKLVLSIAPMPLFTVSRVIVDIVDNGNLLSLAQQLYSQYATATYGVYLPPPALYIGQARNGEMKSASRLPLALDITGKLRLYYTPYPSLYLTREGLEAILNDLIPMVDNRLNAKTYDYKGQITSQMANDMHERFSQLANDPNSILGLAR